MKTKEQIYLHVECQEEVTAIRKGSRYLPHCEKCDKTLKEEEVYIQGHEEELGGLRF